MSDKDGFIELTREQFIQRLIEAGWTKEDAEKEYDNIQNCENGEEWTEL